MTNDRLNEIRQRVRNGPAEALLVDELLAEVESLMRYKRADSRALNFCDEQHFAAIPADEKSDPAFVNGRDNCCPVDILIYQLKTKL